MSDWLASCHRRLSAHLTTHADVAPPWAAFPDYDRYCLGWRMGSGEDWVSMWNVFVDELPRDRAARVAYFRRHPPAPLTWCDRVLSVLAVDGEEEEADDDDDDDDDDGSARRSTLQGALLAAVDDVATVSRVAGDVPADWDAFVVDHAAP